MELCGITKMRVSSALGMIGSADCFLNAIFSVFIIASFLQEFGSAESKFYFQGIFCLIAGILGVFGIFRKRYIWGNFDVWQ